MGTAGFAIVGSSAARAQAWPNGPVKIVVPYIPGGATDTAGRLVAEKMTALLGQQVIVENRGGGNTIIGTEALLRFPPDGHTILLTTASHTILTGTPYDPINDFAPVATLTSSEKVLVIHPSLPVRSMKELEALAKRNPGQLTFASTSAGPQMAGELFRLTTRTNMLHVRRLGT